MAELLLLTAEAPELVSSPDLAVARRAVEAARADDPEQRAQRAQREQILAFLDAHPDALQRSCLAGHLTGSALVVSHDAGAILLLHHRKLGRWLQPGGHADGDATLAAVALREAAEETGIAGLRVAVPAVDLDVHGIPARGDEPGHLHLDVRFLVVAPPGALATGNHESTELRWVAPEDLQAYDPDPSLRRLAATGLAAARHLLRRRPTP